MDNYKKYFSGPKVIFLVLGVAILIEAIYAVKVLTAPLPTPPTSKATTAVAPQLTGGSMSLSANKTELKIGDTVSVAVLFNSGGHTLDGADLIVKFDPKVLEVFKNGLLKGQAFDEYPLLVVDQKAGLISISGINTVKKDLKGTGVLANIVFTAKAKGQTNLTVNFEPNSTSDSNLVEAGTAKDILEKVYNLGLNVQ